MIVIMITGGMMLSNSRQYCCGDSAEDLYISTSFLNFYSWNLRNCKSIPDSSGLTSQMTTSFVDREVPRQYVIKSSQAPSQTTTLLSSPNPANTAHFASFEPHQNEDLRRRLPRRHRHLRGLHHGPVRRPVLPRGRFLHGAFRPTTRRVHEARHRQEGRQSQVRHGGAHRHYGGSGPIPLQPLEQCPRHGRFGEFLSEATSDGKALPLTSRNPSSLTPSVFLHVTRPRVSQRIVAKRYAQQSILLPTVSDTPRTDFDSIKDYFDAFLLKQPQGQVRGHICET